MVLSMCVHCFIYLPSLNVVQWNGGWPQAKVDASFDTDTTFISALGGKTYLAAVSPWFFTHYGPDSYNKNWIYNFDDWLFSTRWEALIQNRDKAPIVEVLTWNGAFHCLLEATCSDIVGAQTTANHTTSAPLKARSLTRRPG